MSEKLRLIEFVLADSGAKTATGATPPDGMVPNILVLRSRGRDGRVFSKTSLKNALSKFEGSPVYVNSSTSLDRSRKGRSSLSRFGKIINCRLFDGRNRLEIRGDLVYLGTHPMAVRLLEALGRGLQLFGFDCILEVDGESNILKVAEVNLVSGPTMDSGLLEQAGADAEKTLPRVHRPARRLAPIPSDPQALARWLKTTH